jgi:hypothetical protein
VTRFIKDPREDYWAAVKHLLRYVKGTIDQGVIFPKTSGARLQLRRFSDTDMAGHVDGWKCTSGVLAFLGSSPVAWQSTGAEGGGAINVQSRVHRSGHGGVPRSTAAPAAE